MAWGSGSLTGSRRASGLPGDGTAREGLAPGLRAAGSRCWGEEPAASAALGLLQAAELKPLCGHRARTLLCTWRCFTLPSLGFFLTVPLFPLLPSTFAGLRGTFPLRLPQAGRCPSLLSPRLLCPVSHQRLCLNRSCPANQSLTRSSSPALVYVLSSSA